MGTRIATFSYRKALDFPMFQKSWFAAEELLRTAEKWVFIGYIIISGGAEGDVRRAYDNYHRFFGRTVNKSTFFSSGLTQEAVAAICK